MDTCSSFALKHVARPRFLRIVGAWGTTLWLLCSSFLLFHWSISPMFAQSGATGHGCAPNTPPPVSGTPVAPPATPGSVLINEVLSNPKSVWNCSEPAGSFSESTDSWIELYNPQDQPFNLYTVHAEISLDGGTNWYTLPFGSAIAPGSFLVLFPLESAIVQPSATWDVELAFASANAIIDRASIPALLADQSYARVPDGSATWQPAGQPTIDASNNASAQPVTATPTRTPRPTVTKTSRQPGSANSSGTGTTTPINTGTQPAGNQLQLPATGGALTTTPAATSFSPFGQSSSTTTGTGLDAWHLAALLALFLLLCGVLLWCWRLFRAS